MPNWTAAVIEGSLCIDGWWSSFPFSRKMSIHMLWYYLKLFRIYCLFHCKCYL